MVYLQQFQIPSDLWVEAYFSPGMTPKGFPYNIDFPHPETNTFHNTWYPWKVFENRFLSIRKFYNGRHSVDLPCPKFNFSDITIFYGGNGSGKSTLLNVIADKLHSSRTVLHNTSPFFDDYDFS